MRTETVKVKGMTCNGCTGKVAHSLKAVNGVHDVVVSLSAGEAAVRYDELVTSPDRLKAAVKSAGYSVEETHASNTPESKGACCG